MKKKHHKKNLECLDNFANRIDRAKNKKYWNGKWHK